MEFELKHCRRCSHPFKVHFDAMDPLESVSARLTVFCQPCLPLALAEAEAKEEPEKRRKLEARWAKICPAQYQDTDISHTALAPEFIFEMQRWKPGRKGLGFVGQSGKGKTRLLYMALKKAFEAGLWVHSVSHLAFRKVAIDAFSAEGQSRYDARAKLDMMSRVDVLLFDDLGKAPSTEAVDSELEELIERRTSQNRTIFWSANAGGQWLIDRFGPDRGEPLVRRLAEFTTAVRCQH